MEKEKIDVIEFDDEISAHILDIFDKEINEKGNVIDKKTQEIIIDRFSEDELNKTNFGGVLPGSEIFISKNEVSIAEYISEIKKDEPRK